MNITKEFRTQLTFSYTIGTTNSSINNTYGVRIKLYLYDKEVFAKTYSEFDLKNTIQYEVENDLCKCLGLAQDSLSGSGLNESIIKNSEMFDIYLNSTQTIDLYTIEVIENKTSVKNIYNSVYFNDFTNWLKTNCKEIKEDSIYYCDNKDYMIYISKKNVLYSSIPTTTIKEWETLRIKLSMLLFGNTTT